MRRYFSQKAAHLTSLFLTLLAVIFLVLVILLNAPLPANSTPSASNASTRLWLVTLTNLSTEYGFGMWGWCEWPSGQGGILGDRDVKGFCKTVPFWRLPNSTGVEDSLRDLLLPE
jgi:hypothetical protein